MFDTPALKTLFAAFPNADQALRFVGGCVRDSLLNVPCQDIDLCTSYTPQDIIQYLTNANIKFVPTGIEHGTVMAILDGKGYEITTLRRDIETDGRHATVQFTDSFQEDAARRDFTINALSRDQQGIIYDYNNGRDDLTAGIIRFIGTPSERITEDYLRILRYFRFFARFSKQDPDPATRKAIQDYAPYLEQISGERILLELKRLLMTKDIKKTLIHMKECEVFYPLFSADIQLDMIQRFLAIEADLDLEIHPLTRFLALIDLDQKILQHSFKRLKLSRKDQNWLETVLHISLTVKCEPLKIPLYYYGIEQTRAALILHHAYENTRPSIGDIKTILAYKHNPFPLTGKDLIAEGIPPGPELGKELKRREKDWVINS